MFTPSRKVYKVRGTYWYQKPLTGEEAAPVRKLFHKPVDPKKTLQENIDVFYEDGDQDTLAALILRPYETTFVHRFLNRVFSRRHGITRENVFGKMELGRQAEVLADFFTLNKSGIGRLLF